MDPGPLRDALTVAVGVGTGVLSGAFGVGGAVISTPGIRALGATAIMSIGTTLPSIIPGAATGARRYASQGLVEWRAVRSTVPAGIVASVLASLSVDHLPGNGHPLMIVTALLLGYSAWRTWRGGGADVARTAHDASGWALAAVGVAAGGLSGLLGVGGGIVMVPAFSVVLGVPLKRAIGTSLVCVGLFAIPGTITHAIVGNIDWRFALWLAVGVIPGAWLGSKLAIAATDVRLRAITGAFLGAVAVVYFVGELSALLL